MKKYDYLLVGAGLFNAVFAYKAKLASKSCLVVEKRGHIGGNIFCENIEGINVHKYGAHIFHTSNKLVWEFVNSVVEFNRYTNSPVANYKGKLFNLPFNMNTFYQMWGVTTPVDAKNKIEEQRKNAIEEMRSKGISEPRNLEEQAISLVGTDIYEKLIKGYTEKQWGRPAIEIPAFVIKRLPVRFTFDNNYFNDKYQGIPIGGYNLLINKLFEGSEIRLNCDYLKNKNELNVLANQIIYSGPIDEYFDFCFGKLDYRSLDFEHKTLDVPNYQGNAVVNFTESEIPYTRIIEHKHFEMFGDDVLNCSKTVITKEYSKEWNEGLEPYYPINDNKNNTLYSKYHELSLNEASIIFGGRLAEYKYYDMHQIVEKALLLTENLLND